MNFRNNMKIKNLNETFKVDNGGFLYLSKIGTNPSDDRPAPFAGFPPGFIHCMNYPAEGAA